MNLAARTPQGARIARWDLYPLTDLAASPHDTLPDLTRAMLAGGARVIQLRMKGASTAEIAASARALLPLCREADADLIVNDDAEACVASGADGLHLGQDDMDPAEARGLIGPDKILGVSTHSPEQIEAARRAPLDYIAVGPVFATASKENPDPVVGLDLIRHAKNRTGLPLVAIGGITRQTILQVIGAGAGIVAVIGAANATDDVTAAVRDLRAAWA